MVDINGGVSDMPRCWIPEGSPLWWWEEHVNSRIAQYWSINGRDWGNFLHATCNWVVCASSKQHHLIHNFLHTTGKSSLLGIVNITIPTKNARVYLVFSKPHNLPGTVPGNCTTRAILQSPEACLTWFTKVTAGDTMGIHRDGSPSCPEETLW